MQISPDQKPCGYLEGIHVYVHILCLTQILDLLPWNQNYCRLYYGFLLVWGWKAKGKFMLILHKALCRNPMAVASAHPLFRYDETCGKSTCSTDLLYHLTLLTQMISKELEWSRRSVSLKIQFIYKCTKRKPSFKNMAGLFLNNIKQKQHRKCLQESHFFIIIKTWNLLWRKSVMDKKTLLHSS